MPWPASVSRASQQLLNAVFPWQCSGCQQLSRAAICANCINLLQPAQGKCVVCAQPSLLGTTHPKCQSPWTVNGILSGFDYHQGNLDKMIVSGKYSFLPDIFVCLGQALASWIKQQRLEARFQTALIVPMPLAKKRYAWRGFNQSEILAKTLGQCLNLPVSYPLQRHKNTKNQKDLGRVQRLINVRDAFVLQTRTKIWYDFIVTPKNTPVSPRGRTVLLIDDVVTTGATLREAGKILLKNGSAEVWGLAVAQD